MPAPLVIGLAAGALGFVLGKLGNKKSPPKGHAHHHHHHQRGPQRGGDHRLDRIEQNQHRQGQLLNRVLGNQRQILGNQQQILGNQQQLNAGHQQLRGGQHQIMQNQGALAALSNPAALHALFHGAHHPGAFAGRLAGVLAHIPHAHAC